MTTMAALYRAHQAEAGPEALVYDALRRHRAGAPELLEALLRLSRTYSMPWPEVITLESADLQARVAVTIAWVRGDETLPADVRAELVAELEAMWR